MTPDQMAATPPPPEWRGHPLPEAGRHVRLDYRIEDNGRTRWTRGNGFVGDVRAVGDKLVVELRNLDGTQSHHGVTLDASYSLDKWTYTGNTTAEHEYRRATDPIYRHHSDTLDEKMGLARLRAEQAERDFAAAVPDVVVDYVEKWGIPLGDLDERQRAVYAQHRTRRPPEPSTYSDPAVRAAVAEVTGSGVLSDDVDSPSDDDGTAVPDPDADDIPGRLRRLQWLKAEIDSLEAQVKATRDEYRALNADTVREMAGEGMTSASINGQTAYFAPKSHVERKGDATADDVMDAMRAAGLEHMIKPGYSGQTLKAYLAELERDGHPVPSVLADTVELVTEYEIRFRRAAASRSRTPRTAPAVPGGGVPEDEPLPTDPTDF